MQLFHSRVASTAIGLGLVSSLSFAAFSNAFVPGFRGSANTEFSQWEDFTVAFMGPNSPDDPASTSDDAVIVQLTPGAILTSTMNIYNPGANSVFELSDAVPEDLQEVCLQFRTLGSPPNTTDVALEYLDGTGSVVLVPFDTSEERWNSGGALENLFRWDLSDVADEILSYTLHFEASAPNFSLDTVQLDTRFGDDVLGTAFCQGNPNSTGQVGSLIALGSALASDNDVTLRASDLPLNQFGYFLNSPTQGVVNPAGSQGVLCVVGQIGRHSGLLGSTGLDGRLEGVLDLSQLPRPSGGPVVVMAGETWNFQCWHRDSNPTPTSNFTNAVQIDFL